MIAKIKEIFRTLFTIPYNSCVAPVRPKDYDGNAVGCTIKCPHCNTWSHELTKAESARALYEDKEPINEKKALYLCGHCTEISEWFTGAPMPIPYSDVRKVE